MEAKTELASEVDAEQEETVIALGDASEETRGGEWGWQLEFAGRYVF